MKLIAQVKLLPTPAQASALRRTLEAANAACAFVSEQAWQAKIFRQFDLHHLCYRDVRVKFGLSAQVTVRVIAKVADAYRLGTERKRRFRPTGSIAYDARVLAWRLAASTVSIWTLDGRLRIPFECGGPQRELLQTRRGETDLVLFRDKFFLSATCEMEEPALLSANNALGIDLGVTNIAVDSDGVVHSAKHINNVRHRHRRLRAKLQAKGTRSAKRRLAQLSGREGRFARDVNHCVSKKIVTKAKDTGRAIALEDLSGLRSRVTVRRRQRVTLNSWAFFQLRQFVQYKAQRAGIPVIMVDPRNTSRTCPACGCVDKRNRKSQSTFACVSCGHSGHADTIAAENIRRAAVNQPNAAPLGIYPMSGNVARDEAVIEHRSGPRQSVATSHHSLDGR